MLKLRKELYVHARAGVRKRWRQERYAIANFRVLAASRASPR
jgi:hypothetical protein